MDGINTLLKLFALTFLLFITNSSCKEDELLTDPVLPLDHERIERFEIQIDISNPNILGQKKYKLNDKGLIIFPIGYGNKKPTKLVIYCHSGRGTVTNKYSEAENSMYCQYLVSLGYAVMDMAAMPEKLSDSLKIDYGRNVGSHFAVRSYFEGYKHIVSKFNIDTTGCYMFCNSGGGLVNLNLGHMTTIPVIAQAGIDPLLSIEQNAWNIISGAMTGGEFSSYQNRANIIRIYGMKNINSITELNNSIYEKEKVGNYDPYDFFTKSSENIYSIPFKIFQTKDDQIVYYEIAKKFVDINNKKGGNLFLRTYEIGGHTAEPVKDTVTTYKYFEKKYMANSTMMEVANWFETYGGYPAQ